METTELLFIGIIALAVSLTIIYFLIKNAVKAANSELLKYLKVIAKIKGKENLEAYNEFMKDAELLELQKKKSLLSSDEYRQRHNKILEQYNSNN